jgi:hypothetical protein
MVHRKQTLLILLPWEQRGQRIEMREHFRGYCKKPRSKRCKFAKRMSLKIARDHGSREYPLRRRKMLRGAGCCGGGCNY